MMNTFQGIAMDTWVDIDGSCPIDVEVVGQQAQFQLGHATGSLHLVLNEKGLGKLTDALAAALAKLRNVDQPSEAMQN
jgi:hypothetical protein